MLYTQDKQLLAIDTPLGKDVLLLQGFTGQEGVTQLFRFDLDLLSEDASIYLWHLLLLRACGGAAHPRHGQLAQRPSALSGATRGVL
jgi:uncharacterized protein involved in type VI secretion and phage assembly